MAGEKETKEDEDKKAEETGEDERAEEIHEKYNQSDNEGEQEENGFYSPSEIMQL